MESLRQARVDVLVTAATPASRAARAATSTLPIVFVAVADPVRAELVATLTRPGGNATGLTLLTPALSGKRLELLAGVAPGRRLAVLTNPANLSHAVFFEETQVAATAMGTRRQALEARTAEDLEGAFETVAKVRASAMIVFDDPVLGSHRKRIVALAEKRRLPVM